jgi:hypothetical protein
MRKNGDLILEKTTNLVWNNYTIDQQEYDWLIDFVQFMGYKKVLEFGPGNSTFAFSDAGCRVDSYESEASYYEEMILKFSENPRVRVYLYENLPTVEIDAGMYDMAFVDGPAFWYAPTNATHAFARRNTLRCASKHANVILLHDSKREPELTIVSEFLQENPSWQSFNFCNSNRGIITLKKSI